MHVEYSETVIAFGQYIIFKKKEQMKLRLLSEKNNCMYVGKDKIDLDAIIGEKFGSVFKMVPKEGFSRHFILQLCGPSVICSAIETFKDFGSGLDNRSICDDGLSQSMTSDNIEVLRDKGIAPKVIIEQLVENSKTFQIKTEFSQEKYIKKKEKKYFDFITIMRPSIRLIAEILFTNYHQPKSVGIRIDTLSQLSSTLNLQSDGNYLLVENGFNGIVAATLLNSLSHEGRLINVTPGNQNQKQAVLAMNFTSTQMSRLITVRLSTMLELMEQELSSITCKIDKSETVPGSCDLKDNANESNHNDISGSSNSNCSMKECKNEISSISTPKSRKRKHSNLESANLALTNKKPRWAMEAELAVELILKKVDGLVVACKESPENIVNKLLRYVLPSRPFVVYSLYQEPLVALYVQLKQRGDIIFLRITETWLRPYQVLPERTHPAVTTSSSSGFLLSGIKVINE